MAEHSFDWVMTLEADTGCEGMKGENGFQTNLYRVAQHGDGMEIVLWAMRSLSSPEPYGQERTTRS